MNAKLAIWKTVLGTTNILGKKLDLSKPTLITIGFSHYSEKARWLMNLSPLEYHEDRHLPAFHLARTLSTEVDRLCRVQMPGIKVDVNDKYAKRKERTSVPKLVLPTDFLPAEFSSQMQPSETACVIKDGSKGISRFLTYLYPNELGHLIPADIADKVLELEDVLERKLACAITQFAFGNFLLCDRNAFPDCNKKSLEVFLRNCQNVSIVPKVQRTLFALLGKSLIIPAMISGNNITAEGTARARKDIIACFEYIENVRNAHGCTEQSNFMFKTSQPTLVDISFAALVAPLLMPPEASNLFFDRNELENLRSIAPGCQQYLELSEFLLSKYAAARAVLRLYADKSLYRPAI